MVKEAKTDEERNKVWDYLKQKGTIPATNVFFYKDNDKGEITGAYGIEVKTCIEPLQADNNLVAHELFYHALGVMAGLGKEKVHFITCNDTAGKILRERFNAVLWSSKGIEEYLIIL